MQEIIGNYRDLNKVINIYNKNILLVCSNSLLNSFICDYLKEHSSNIHIFTEFNSNPKYEEVLKGIEILKKYNCEVIIAIGGGSAIDVAKTIKAFSTLDWK